jgi:hypothetical protein
LDEVIGKYRAFVVQNEDDGGEDTQPYAGCIKVVCPGLFGFQTLPVDGLPFVLLKDLMTVSSWVEPCWSNPMDVYIPEVGEGVYIEAVEGNIQDMVYTGVYPGEDFINMWGLTPREGVNTQLEEVTDRIIGSRNGSYIKIEDILDGKIIIEAGGKNKLVPVRVGPKIVLDPMTASEKIEIISQDKVGAIQHKVIIDATPPGKISIELATGDFLELTPTGIKLENSTGSGLDIGPALVKLFDVAGSVEISPTGIIFKTGDGSLWAPNIITNCLFTSAPHGGAVAGIVKLKGG